MTEVEINERKAAANAAPQTRPAAATSALVPAAVDDESFGRALAAARQARGLSQGEVAAQLRLQLRQVRAIEADDLDALPEGPFVRGFVRNYARLVDVPAEPLLALLAARLKPTEPLRTDGRSAAAINPVQMAAREHASRLTVVGGSVLLLLLFAVLGWWTMRPAEPLPDVARTPAALPPVVPAATPAAMPSSAFSAPEVPAIDGAPATAEATGADEVRIAPTALRFSFRDRSWVEVRQADGTTLMSRLNDAGTQEVLAGTPPYTLVVGNASQVDLEFRGRPVDLTAVASREDVARLRLE